MIYIKYRSFKEWICHKIFLITSVSPGLMLTCTVRSSPLWAAQSWNLLTRSFGFSTPPRSRSQTHVKLKNQLMNLKATVNQSLWISAAPRSNWQSLWRVLRLHRPTSSWTGRLWGSSIDSQKVQVICLMLERRSSFINLWSWTDIREYGRFHTMSLLQKFCLDITRRASTWWKVIWKMLCHVKKICFPFKLKKTEITNSSLRFCL